MPKPQSAVNGGGGFYYRLVKRIRTLLLPTAWEHAYKWVDAGYLRILMAAMFTLSTHCG